MLDNAVVDFIENLSSEREFDLPFMALLRTQDFFDIHFTHGSFEFGKDFIAKRIEEGEKIQYVIQTKYGDVGKTSWDVEVQPQCEKMAYVSISHPCFSKIHKRKSALVLTGRLKGQAAILAEQYQSSLVARKLPELVVWDKNTLVELLLAEHCLGPTAPWTILGQFIEDLDSGNRSITAIEEMSRRWCESLHPKSFHRSVIEFAILSQNLNARGLILQAFRFLIGLLRATTFLRAADVLDASDASLINESIRSTIGLYADGVLDSFRNSADDEYKAFLINHVSDSVICGSKLLLQAEIVSAKALCCRDFAEGELEDIRRFLQFVLEVDAAAKPLSDNYAVSVLLVGLAATKCSISVEAWLRKLTVWICDNYDDGKPGLPACWTNPEAELIRHLANKLPKLICDSNPYSMIAAAVLDSCSFFGFKDLFEDVQNDLIASNARPIWLVPSVEASELLPNQAGCVCLLGGDCLIDWNAASDWKTQKIRHLHKARKFEVENAGWVSQVLPVLLRDRWWLNSNVCP